MEIDPMSPGRRRSLTVISHTDSQRSQLLADLADSLQTTCVPASFWACIKVADINALERFVRQAKASREFCEIIIDNCYAVPRQWKQQIPRDGATTSISTSSAMPSSESPKVPRSKGAKDRAKTRDNSRCVITGFSLPEVAHIFPHCLLNPRKTDLTRAIPSIWKMLFLFFDRDSVQQWQNAVFPDSNNPKDITENLICLQPSLHTTWAAGLCAFKPISLSPDRRELEVEFHWLPRQTHGPLDLVELSKPQPSSHGIDEVDGNKFLVGDNRLCTGDRFTLRTFDPDGFPLPSFTILDMQWRLAQILSLSAAGEDREFDEEDDEEGAASVPAIPLNIPRWIGEISDDDHDLTTEESEEGHSVSSYSTMQSPLKNRTNPQVSDSTRPLEEV